MDHVCRIASRAATPLAQRAHERWIVLGLYSVFERHDGAHAVGRSRITCPGHVSGPELRAASGRLLHEAYAASERVH